MTARCRRRARSAPASPDIIVVSQLVADPDAAFGQGSGQENRDDLSVAALAGVDNYIHLRIKNRGTPTAPGTTGTVYWSETATLVMPSDWTAIGTTAPIDVPQGDTLAVTPALAWPANLLPAVGHYCLTAVLDSPLDPAPALPDAMDWMGFLDFIQNQNNVTWRNINVITAAIKAPPRRLGPLVFAMPGAPDAARRFRFELIQRLPAGARVALEVPTSLAVQLVPDGWQMLHDTKRRATRAIVPTAPRFWLPTVTLAAAARHRAALVFEMDKGVRLDGHSVIIRQLYEDIEVGRIVWRFVAGGPTSEHATPGRMAGRRMIR